MPFSTLSDCTSWMLCHTDRHVAAFVFLSVSEKFREHSWWQKRDNHVLCWVKCYWSQLASCWIHFQHLKMWQCWLAIEWVRDDKQLFLHFGLFGLRTTFDLVSPIFDPKTEKINKLKTRKLCKSLSTHLLLSRVKTVDEMLVVGYKQHILLKRRLWWWWL